MPRSPRRSPSRSSRSGRPATRYSPYERRDVNRPGASYELLNTPATHSPRQSYASAVQRRENPALQETAPREATATRPVTSRHRLIMFYRREDPYFEFTNFSPHPIRFKERTYPTAEHLFQAHKFLEHYPEHAENIRMKRTAREALQEATRLKRLVRTDWFQINVSVMDHVLRLKFDQNPTLQQLLVGTGDRTLIEDSPVDAFWGCGAHGEGQNQLGNALMRLRDELAQRSGDATTPASH